MLRRELLARTAALLGAGSVVGVEAAAPEPAWRWCDMQITGWTVLVRKADGTLHFGTVGRSRGAFDFARRFVDRYFPMERGYVHCENFELEA